MTVAALKVPPHSIDAEQAVIGALLLDSASWDAVSEIVHPGDFYRREHRTIFEAMAAQMQAGKPIDVINLSEALHDANKLAEAGGLDYLGALLSSSMSAANIRAYAALVRERATERHLISTGHAIADMGYNAEDRTAAERVALAQSLLSDLEAPEGSEPVSVDVCLREAIAELQRRLDRKGELLGLPTGFTDVDKRTQGLMPGNLIVVAGRPGMGKSTFAFNIAEHAAAAGRLVIVFSLEMSREELMLRMISSAGRIPFNQVRTVTMTDDHWSSVASVATRFKGRPLYIDDNSMLTSAQVLSRARRISRRMGMPPALIVVDYLQLLADKGEGVERVTKISRNLKLAAKELGCPVMALSQLNRGVEGRNDKRPAMADLRDSGSIEQDSDLILMLYREEEYDKESPRKGIVEVICRKFRNGETGTDYLVSNLHMSRFDNLQPGWVPPQDAPKKRGGFQYGD